LQVREPRHWLPRVRNAGAVFLGAWSPESLADYCTGPNHVLPTYGYARALSGLSVRDSSDDHGAGTVARRSHRTRPHRRHARLLEGLDAHAQAVTRRLGALTGLAS